MKATFRPMLACEADLRKLRFPLLASAKLDGIRATVRNGVVMSRSNKPIPNAGVQAKFKHLENFDGELIVGLPTAHDVMRQTTSIVMSDSKPAYDVNYYMFDHIGALGDSYVERAKRMRGWGVRSDIFMLSQVEIRNLDELLAYENACLDQGYEGLILRDPAAPYKCGRSTANEQYLLKMKRFVDAEAVVVGFEERMHNGNEAVTNELGRTKRSSHQSGKSGRGDLGALVCQFDGVEFNIGTGFTDSERAALWAERDSGLVGRLAKFKYVPVGVKEAPRHPVFLGWRDARDM